MAKTGPAALALVPFISLLLDQVKELYSRCEAMRLVLDAHDLLPDDEYQKRRADCVRTWDATFQAEVTRAVLAATDQGLQQMLEKHSGTKQ